MNYRSLADLLEDLQESGDLERIDADVDPLGEAAETVRKRIAESGTALLLSSVKGHDLPVAVNLFGSERRICRGLGVGNLSEVAERIGQLMSPPNCDGLFAKLLGATRTDVLAKIAPRTVRSAACQQIVRLGGDVDLSLLPLLRAAPVETERWIPAAPLVAAAADSHQAISGRFDLQIIDRRQMAVCLAEYDDLDRHWKEYRRRNEKMPLTVVLGGEPAFMLASAAVLPGKIDACSLAGLLREKPLDVVACRSIELAVPAEAEIVLEGYLDPQAAPVMTGPMLSPLGEMTPPRLAPIMHVTAMTHRANPVYPAFLYGRPPHEAITVARAMKQIFLPMMKVAIEDLVDYDLPEFGAALLWATLSIRKGYAGQVQRVANAAAALRPFWFAKWLVIVDDEINVCDAAAVSAAMAANVSPARDVWTQQMVYDPCDPTAVSEMIGTRMVIDATRK
jgi:4-hydroxy-3-polyprenylbenzoate decarboxylase